MNANLKRFISYYKPYRGLFALDMACALASAAIALIIPIGVRRITGELLASTLPTALRDILVTGAWLAVLGVIGWLCFYVVDYLGHYMGAKIERDLRKALFGHLERLCFSFYDDHKTGQLMSRLTNDTVSLAEFYHHGPEDYVISCVKFVGAFVVLAGINWQLTLCLVGFVTVMTLITVLGSRIMRRILKLNKQHIADINAQVEDSLAGIRVVQSFAGEAAEQKKFDAENEKFLESRRQWYRIEAVVYGAVEALAQLMTIGVAVYGAVLIYQGQMTLPDLVGFLLYCGYLSQPILKLMWMTEQFQDGLTSFERLMELLDMKPDITDKKGAKALSRVQGDVAFHGVSFRYKDKQAHVLKGINFAVAAGGYVALVGSSGVGKTTLCSLVPRFYDVTEGKVTLDGQDVRDITLDSLRRHIGVVHQDVYLFAGTIKENIRYGKEDATDDEVIDAAMKANAHQFIMGLPDGYDTDIGQRGIKLSGGQRQRLSIARVFLKDPKVLIFDEATSALDSESEQAVKQTLETLSRDRTTLVIAHRLSTVKGADRILVLTENGIEQQGTHEALIQQDGAYRNLYWETV